MTSEARTSVHLTSLAAEVTDLGPMPTLSTRFKVIAQSAATTASSFSSQSPQWLPSMNLPRSTLSQQSKDRSACESVEDITD
jgi:hypothetical protein